MKLIKCTFRMIIILMVLLPSFSSTQTTIDTNQYQSFIPDLRKKIEQNPYNSLSWKVLTQAYLDLGKSDSAAFTARSSEKYLSDDITLFAFYADLFWKASLYSEAAVWIEKLYSSNPSEQLRTLLINAYHNAGVKQAQTSDWKQAALYFQKALELDSDTEERYSPLALVYAKDGKFEEALEIIDQGSKGFGKSKQLMEIEKYIHVQKKDFHGLEKILETYVNNNPDDVEARLDLNRVRNVLGKSGKALNDLDKMKEKFPENTKIYGELSSLQKQTAQFALERQTYIDMLDQYPEADSLYLKIAHTYEKEHNWTKAREYYNQYCDKYPGTMDCMLLIANTYRRESKLDSALFIYRDVIKKEAKNVKVLELAGETAADIHRYQEALEYFQSWAEEVPENPLPLIAQAKVLQKLGRTQEARERYENAEKIKGCAFSAFQLFLIHKKMGNLDRAKEFQSLALQRSIEEIAEEEKQLKSSVSVGVNFNLNENNIKTADEIKVLKNILDSIVDNWIPDKNNGSLERQLKNLLDEHPHVPIILNILADIYFKQNEYNQAELYYKKFLSFNPRSIDGQLGLARVYERVGNDKAAFITYLRIVELDFTSQESYQSAIRFAEKTGKLDQLARRWDQLYRAHEKVEMLKKHLILVWNKLGRNDKIREIIE